MKHKRDLDQELTAGLALAQRICDNKQAALQQEYTLLRAFEAGEGTLPNRLMVDTILTPYLDYHRAEFHLPSPRLVEGLLTAYPPLPNRVRAHRPGSVHFPLVQGLSDDEQGEPVGPLVAQVHLEPQLSTRQPVRLSWFARVAGELTAIELYLPLVGSALGTGMLLRSSKRHDAAGQYREVSFEPLLDGLVQRYQSLTRGGPSWFTLYYPEGTETSDWTPADWGRALGVVSQDENQY